MITATKPLPVPSFYKAKNAEEWSYEPNEAGLLTEGDAWGKKHGIRPAGSDKAKVHLLLIDVQKDFCYPKGTLYVGGRKGDGAIEDSKRTAEFIYKNLGRISDITCTMDSHFRYQIFFPDFWLTKDDGPVAPHTVITADMVKAGDVKPNMAIAKFICNGNYGWLVDYAKHYCSTLEKAGKYKLYVWPYHCLMGTVGHTLVGVIEEARAFHQTIRKNMGRPQIKGGHFLTENYSVLSPEVMTDHTGKPLKEAQKNVELIRTLIESDYVVIAGQAASHCVKSSIDDLLSAITAQDPKLTKKVYIMEDCMSAVAVPDGKGGFYADFTPQAEDALKKFADAGMHVVKSTTPMEDWEGLNL